MDLLTMLEFISVQRHDFLNHLQVISGLVQLNKSDRVIDYIRQVCIDVERLSKVIHLKNPYVAAALLLGNHQAEMHQVVIDFNIQTDFEECAVPAGEMGSVLYEALSRAVNYLASPEISGRRIALSLAESDKKYLCRISFPESPASGTRITRDVLTDMEKLLSPFGGKVGLAVSGGEGEIHIICPRMP
ncbi:signal transduction histidine kinase [Desulfocucumis palustris]|uniref:Signal transduction histidine kinase n=1 Tax=Desulfocucumis palustris TaxID=1898651 RepID=A0A2L2XES9_9FIRM|nr:Spo0B domain-containing protein [Desulfocucumis palustris]GBF34869.1 signal transduction histidine kinase [Desulfocucumis palustris]